MAKKLRVILCSGLSLFRINSFSTQLGLLARGLERAGCVCTAIGISPRASYSPSLSRQSVSETSNSRGSFSSPNDIRLFPESVHVRDVPELTMSVITDVVQECRADAIILLGYPDQFTFLETLEPPIGSPFPTVFLWAQFSQPPTHLPAGIHVVPLTDVSRNLALSADANHELMVHVTEPVPHAVDMEIFRPQHESERESFRKQAAIPDDVMLLGYVATNQYRKRHDRLIDSFAEIRASATECRRKVHLCIKTDRRDSSTGFQLTKLVQNRNLDDSITVVEGLTGEQDLARIIGCLDLYVHVSEWEGFGIPAIEALSCGIPVVTHAGQGPGEFTPFPELIVASDVVIDDSGASLSYVDIHSVAQVVTDFVTSSDTKRERYAMRARRYAAESFSIDAVSEMWCDLVGRFS